jgi:hypothetical protein
MKRAFAYVIYSTKYLKRRTSGIEYRGYIFQAQLTTQYDHGNNNTAIRAAYGCFFRIIWHNSIYVNIATFLRCKNEL